MEYNETNYGSRKEIAVKLGRGGEVHYLENGELLHDKNDVYNQKRVVLVYGINGNEPLMYDDTYAIGVHEDGKIVTLKHKYGTIAEAKAAARAIALSREDYNAYVFKINYSVDKPVYGEKDGEEEDRFYEDNGIIRGMHPEQNT